MPPAIKNESRLLIANVIKYCEKEKADKQPTIPIHKANARAAALTGESLKSIKRVRKLLSANGDVSSPVRNVVPVSKKFSLNNFDVCALRHTIRDFYTKKQQTPTLRHLLPTLVSEKTFSGTKVILRKVLHNLGFSFKKNSRKGRLLLEKSSIIVARTLFLNKIMKNMNLLHPQPIVFIFKTVLKLRSEKNIRNNTLNWRILFASTETGIMHRSLFAYKANTKQRKSEMFLKWFQLILMPNLKEPCLIVMDSLLQQLTEMDKRPGYCSSKLKMKDWLKRHQISFNNDFHHAELLELIERSKVTPEYECDTIARYKSHKIAVLPSRHDDLNPLTNIWALIRPKLTIEYYNGITSHNIEDLIKGLIKEVDMKEWQESFSMFYNLVTKYYEDEIIIDNYTD